MGGHVFVHPEQAHEFVSGPLFGCGHRADIWRTIESGLAELFEKPTPNWSV